MSGSENGKRKPLHAGPAGRGVRQALPALRLSLAVVQPAPLGDLTPCTAPCARPPSTQDFRRVTNRVTPRNQTQIYAEFYNKSNAGVAAMETMEEREEGHGTAQRTQRERTRWASQGRRASQNPLRFHRQTDRVSV